MLYQMIICWIFKWKKKNPISAPTDPSLVHNVRPCSLQTGHDCDVNKNQSPLCVCPEVPRVPGVCAASWRPRSPSLPELYVTLHSSLRLANKALRNTTHTFLLQHLILFVTKWRNTKLCWSSGPQSTTLRLSVLLGPAGRRENWNISALFQVLDGLPGTSGCSCVSAVPGSTVTSACTSPESNLSIWTSGPPSRCR